MPRRRMTYRVVPLASPEAGESHLGDTPAERMAMLAELSRAAWLASGRVLPVYTRATMPFRMLTLGDLTSARER
jgi:hypothetical protein